MLFKRKENLFKKIHRQTKAEVRAEVREIKRTTADPAERLARYETVRKKFSGLYGDGKVQKSVRDITIERVVVGLVAGLTGTLVALGAIIGGAALLLFPPLVVPAAVALGVGAGFVIRQMFYRSEAKRLNLTTRDVKFAIKTQRLEGKLVKNMQSLYRATQKNETKKDLETLRHKFDRGAAGKVAAETQMPIAAIKSFSR